MQNHVIRATCYGLGLMTLVVTATAAVSALSTD